MEFVEGGDFYLIKIDEIDNEMEIALLKASVELLKRQLQLYRDVKKKKV